MSIAFPTLWTPWQRPDRLRPLKTWRQRASELFSLKHDAATGHLLHNAGGHLVDECEAAPAGCTRCTNYHDQYDVTFNGDSTICTNCHTDGDGHGYNYTGASPLSGTFRVTGHPVTTCLWELVLRPPGMIVVAHDIAASCAGAQLTPDDEYFRIQLRKVSATSWTMIVINGLDMTSHSSGPNLISAGWFQGTPVTVASNDCDAPFTMTNSNTLGNCTGIFGNAAWGGTADVSPV